MPFFIQEVNGFLIKIQGAEHRNICHAFGLMAQNALIAESTKNFLKGAAHHNIPKRKWFWDFLFKVSIASIFRWGKRTGKINHTNPPSEDEGN